MPKLKLQVRILEAVLAPVLADHDVASKMIRFHSGINIRAEGVGLKRAAGQGVGLTVSHMLPSSEGVRVDRLVQAVVNGDVVGAGGGDKFLNVADGRV